MKMAFKNIGAFVLATSSFIVHAQVVSFSKYEVGINAGSFIYLGDLTPSAVGSFKTPAFVFGLNGSRYLTNKFAVRLDLSFGRLKGNDAAYDNPAWRQQRNFAFKTPVTEVTSSVVWNALGRERKLSPYLFAGVGYSFLRIKKDYSNFNAEYFVSEASTIDGLQNDIEHRLPRGLPIIPAGIGLRYRLTNSLLLNSEVAYHYSSSDYLDGFSQAANSGKKDSYHKFSIGLTYSPNRHNNSLDCPRF